MSEINLRKILFENFSNYLKTSLQTSQFKEVLEVYEENEINELIKESFNIISNKKNTIIQKYYSKAILKKKYFTDCKERPSIFNKYSTSFFRKAGVKF